MIESKTISFEDAIERRKRNFRMPTLLIKRELLSLAQTLETNVGPVSGTPEFLRLIGSSDQAPSEIRVDYIDINADLLHKVFRGILNSRQRTETILFGLRPLKKIGEHFPDESMGLVFVEKVERTEAKLRNQLIIARMQRGF